MILSFPPDTSLFTRYKLTDKDVIAGYQLSSATLAVLYNLQATISEEKLALVFTPSDVMSYLQQEAFKAGQLAVIDSILQEAEVAHQSAAQSNQEN